MAPRKIPSMALDDEELLRAVACLGSTWVRPVDVEAMERLAFAGFISVIKGRAYITPVGVRAAQRAALRGAAGDARH